MLKKIFESIVLKRIFNSIALKRIFETIVLRKIFESIVLKKIFESIVLKRIFKSIVLKKIFESIVLKKIFESRNVGLFYFTSLPATQHNMPEDRNPPIFTSSAQVLYSVFTQLYRIFSFVLFITFFLLYQSYLTVAMFCSLECSIQACIPCHTRRLLLLQMTSPSSAKCLLFSSPRYIQDSALHKGNPSLNEMQ